MHFLTSCQIEKKHKCRIGVAVRLVCVCVRERETKCVEVKTVVRRMKIGEDRKICKRPGADFTPHGRCHGRPEQAKFEDDEEDDVEEDAAACAQAEGEDEEADEVAWLGP